MMFERAIEWVKLKKYQYQVTTGIHMLEPWERSLFNATVLSLLAMSLYSTYAYLPAYTRNALIYFGFTEEQ